MIVWFWANALLSVLALTFVQLNGNAPHRLRFIVCFIAMCCWLVPWNLLGQLAPAQVVATDLLPTGTEALTVAAQTVPPAISGPAETVFSRLAGIGDSLLIAVVAIGVLLFAASCYRYLRFLGRMSVTSRSGEYLRAEVDLAAVGARRSVQPRIRIQQAVPGAITTGFFVPTVWVHEDMLVSPNLKAALVHEFTHVRNHDNAYLWAMTFMQKVLWWNPFVLYLGRQARRLQELSCDEACDKRLSGYRDMLNRLILNLSRIGKHRDLCVQQTSSIFGYKNFNVQRIRALEKRYVMKIRHYASTALLLLLSVFALGWATAQDQVVEEEIPVATMPPEFTTLEEAFEAMDVDQDDVPGLEPGMTIEEANEAYRRLGLYAEMLNRQFDEQEAHIIALNQELEELRNTVAAQAAAESAQAVPEPIPVSRVDSEYQLVVQTSPVYPPRARGRGLEGYVILDYTITESGSTEDISVVESTASLFDRAAVDAVRGWEYSPRIVDGVAVEVPGVQTRIDFELDD